MITGRCECAKVRYEVDCELKDFCHCHCSICRRLHGAAFASWGGIARDKFSYISGEDSVKRYAFSENSDSIFCTHCGSRLLVDCKPETHMLYLALGTADGDLACPPGFHQFVGSKARWHEIHDDLPQYDEWPDES
ncbi:MAG TPA: GFA family protein [Pseudomonadales bacterium]|nr:ribulose phosphate epimerase [Gammaproteobacteria bacterium]MDP6026293.1 GFA family protein [Pseudomonadales bacterium]MDP7451357.1 GFA family protein [Arenicellales bacterium]MDP7314072.1 GFA family protein [Pseudomonadales bacterium]MDP7576885.1 GFA family protein [Pseudomonadales bacterium]